MLGNKRKINKKQIHHKPLSEKLKQLSKKKQKVKDKDKDEESIKSNDDIIGNSSDSEVENKKKIMKKNKIINLIQIK